MIELYIVHTQHFSNERIDSHICALSSYDLARANKIYNTETRKRFITTRILFYKLLEKKWILKKNILLQEFRKPFIKNSKKHASISYSDKYSLIALSEIDIGVDMETIRGNLKIQKSDILSHYELECNNVLRYNIFKIRTLKEAIVKLLWSWFSFDIKSINLYWLSKLNNYIVLNTQKIYLASYRLGKKYISVASTEAIRDFKIIHIKHEKYTESLSKIETFNQKFLIL